MRRLALLPLALAALPLGAAGAEPALGRYEGRWCVAVGQASADCGPAQVDVLRQQRVNVRIADIVYRLKLHSSQVDVVLMHGTMQIDGFFAPYEWVGNSLQFLDLEKRTRYELTLAPSAKQR
ncbi:MAG: hypothetical protein AB7U92_13560 [Piscinibacter sp.]|uniref:hypothetical protein n=1 Tax=Piscinibacter sp. TaxID=1903157 RepID=UPI003D0F12B1